VVDRPQVSIVTDSTADLAPALRDQHGIVAVPLNVVLDGQTYRDQVDITTPDFMAKLPTAKTMPSTSQPSPAAFEEAYRAAGGDVVAVLISSKLSGTCQSATLAADALAGQQRVEVVDSLNASLGLGFQVLRAADLAAQGRTAAQIADRLRAETALYHLVFFVDTLEYLQKGGRIGRAASVVGGMLKLKPLLRVDEGQIVPFERTRTRARAIEGLKDFVRGFPSVSRLGVLYSTEADQAEALATDLSGVVPRDNMVLAQFSPVIGAHVGPGAMGVCVFEGPTS
jgi:DegV family protein with EDD domain